MDAYENLSEDDHVAFLQLEKEFRNDMEVAQEDPNSNWAYITADYMNKTLAAADALGVNALSVFSVNTRDNNEHSENFNDFLRDVDNVIIQMRF